MPFRPDPDEGPSHADQRRFGDDRITTGACPDCGGEVMDDAEVCPRCFAYIGGDVKPRSRVRRGIFHERWKTLLVLLVIAGMLSGVLAYIF